MVGLIGYKMKMLISARFKIKNSLMRFITNNMQIIIAITSKQTYCDHGNDHKAAIALCLITK